MSEMQETSTREPDTPYAPDTRGEFVKFGAIAAILLGTVLVIWLLRPFIFNVIVPAVMGEGQPTAPMPLEAENQMPLKEPPAIDANAPTPTSPVETDIFIPTIPVAGNEAAPVDEVVAEPGGEETAVFTQHTVQPGENLTTIAQKYGITIDAIIAINDIPNPNRITAGTVLQIPRE